MFELGSQAVIASRWSFLGELCTKALAPLVFLALAQLLAPEDFGIVAVASAIISFSNVFWDAGLTKALVMWRGDIDRASSTVFWLNLLLSIAVFALLFVLADFLAALNNDASIGTVLRVLSFQLLISAFSATHLAMYQRDLDFKTLTKVRLPVALASAFVTLLLAALGYRYWSLVAGTLVGTTLQTVRLWRARAWRPALAFDTSVAKQMLSVGRWIVGEGVLAWFYLWADAMIVGAILGAHELGLYRTGNSLIIMAFGLLFGPQLPVIYAYFSRSDREQLPTSILWVSRLIATLSLPLGMASVLLGDDLGAVAFGPEWSGIGVVISVMGLTHGLAWIVGAHGEAYRAIGRADVNTKIMALGLLVYLPAYAVGAAYGLTGFLWVRLTCTVFGIGLHVIVQQRCLGISLQTFTVSLSHLALSALLAVFAAGSLAALLDINSDSVQRIISVLGFGGGIYGVSLFILERRFLVVIMQTLRHPT